MLIAEAPGHVPQQHHWLVQYYAHKVTISSYRMNIALGHYQCIGSQGSSCWNDASVLCHSCVSLKPERYQPVFPQWCPLFHHLCLAKKKRCQLHDIFCFVVTMHEGKQEAGIDWVTMCLWSFSALKFRKAHKNYPFFPFSHRRAHKIGTIWEKDTKGTWTPQMDRLSLRRSQYWGWGHTICMCLNKSHLNGAIDWYRGWRVTWPPSWLCTRLFSVTHM